MIVLLLAFFTLSSLLAYYLYFRPLSIINRYSRQFSKMGYKVYTFPYNPFDAPIFTTILKDSQKGDPFQTYKQKFVGYDILVGNILFRPGISALSPSARKQFTKHQVDNCYQKIPAISDLFIRVLGKGLVFSEGEEWKRKRRILSKFFTYDFLNSKIPQILKICQQQFDLIESEEIKIKESEGNKFDYHLRKLAERTFSSVVMSLFLGGESIEQEIDGQRLCYFIINLIIDNAVRANQKGPLILGYRYMDLGLTRVDADINRRKILFNKWANQYIQKMMQRAEQKKSKLPTNLIELLYSETKNKEGQKFGKQELIDELKTFFFAGADTTAHLFQMMVYFTAKNSQVDSVVRKQIEEVKEIRSSSDLKRLKYIQSIQKETIRYYGPLPLIFPRIVRKEHYFNGVRLEIGSTVQFHSVTTHFNSDYYQNAFEFKPDRWTDKKKDFDGSQLVGFGMGPRSCIGQYLALVQSKIAFYCFMKKYKKIGVPEKINFSMKLMNEAQNLYVTLQKK